MAVTLSTKRQIVIPADVCRGLAIAPGARVDVEISPDGQFATVRPTRNIAPQPKGKLIGMLKHKGKPVPVEAMNGSHIATRLAREGKL
jgi:AbrB family looped-hinge helix DNA binding protein